AQTRLSGIAVQVGRTGTLTPVAQLDPVKLAGTVVSRASLHNQQIIDQLDVRIGDLVTIEKAGEIIPQVVAIDLTARPNMAPSFRMPPTCPVCDTPVVRRTGEVALRCPNAHCPAVVKQSLVHFARRFAMDIDHLGEAVVDALVEHGLVTDVADLYDLDVETVARLPRMGKKSARNLIEAIAASKSRVLERLITGFGFELIGQVAARQLAEVARTLEALLRWTEADVRAKLEGVAGFGPKMIDSLWSTLSDTGQRAVLEKLLSRGVSVAQPRTATTEINQGPLTGKAFCVTGVLSRRREDVQLDIQAAGGLVHEQVKRGTNYLVAGERVGKSKLDAAKKFNVEVIDENRLVELIRNNV
ncbi:MAG TPA: helix-hairpin-helix domain-containing protein, partial [Polyangiaceae bacterium]